MKRRLVESGELTTGEPCTPYIMTKCDVNSEGEIEVRATEIILCGHKISLLELKAKIA